MYYKSSRIYTEDGVKDGYLRVEDGVFGGVMDTVDGECIDYGNMRIIPGIFDTHIHGTMGYRLMDIASEEQQRINVRGFLKGCASQGVTSVFPTADIGMIKAVGDVAKEPINGAEITGIHSEGPWLNRTGEKGQKKPWPEVGLASAERMVADGGGLLKLVAMAPEIDGIDEVAQYFLSKGIVIANAHSDNGYEPSMQAYDERGFTVSTHTGNVMVGMHHRDIGGLGAALLNDKVDCEVICDGLHISLPMLQIYFKVKDYSRFMMMSDLTPFSGAPAGKYKAVTDDTDITVTEEGFVLSDTGRIFGSTQPVLYGIYNLVEKLGIHIDTVLKMSSLNACRKYGLDASKGSIADGKDADFVVISDDYKAIATFVRGSKVYDREADGDVFNPDFKLV